MSWLVLTVLGVILNCIGLSVFGDGIVHRTSEAGAAMAGTGDMLLAFVLINLGIVLMILGIRRRP